MNFDFLQVVANFSASWCGPCRMIAPLYKELSQKYPSLMFLTIDVDELMVRSTLSNLVHCNLLVHSPVDFLCQLCTYYCLGWLFLERPIVLCLSEFTYPSSCLFIRRHPFSIFVCAHHPWACLKTFAEVSLTQGIKDFLSFNYLSHITK